MSRGENNKPGALGLVISHGQNMEEEVLRQNTVLMVDAFVFLCARMLALFCYQSTLLCKYWYSMLVLIFIDDVSYST